MADPRLKAFVAGRNVPCPVCGYNLRDLEQERCPECGTLLDLGLIMALDQSFHARRRAVVAALCIFGLTAIVGFVIGAFTRRSPHIVVLAIPLVVFGLVFSGVILVVDRSIYEARAQSARARSIPSFGRVTWTWAGLLALGTLVFVAVLVVGLLP